ncbi:MAG: hypothetical protein ACJ75E_08630 [Actinomycetes bacterium]
MAYRFTPADRGAFKRCRRQWDFGARERHNYEPADGPAAPDLELAVRDALAVYYFPGMWDWQRSVVLPLVLQGLARSLGGQPAAGGQAAGEALLRRYFEWAPGVDRFSPIQVECRLEVNLPDPAGGGRELVLPDGRPIRYQGRVDLLAGDEHDRYWVVAHRLIDRFGTAEELLLDEELVAACWAMERFFPGMRIAGTIHNELRPANLPVGMDELPPKAAPRRSLPWRRSRHERGIPQHEASGGGRSLPYARRGGVRAGPPGPAAVASEGDGRFRRTRIPRGRAELEAAGARLAAEALDMVDPGLRLYPNPAPEHCGSCQFVAPCLAVERGGDVAAVLAAAYRDRGPERVEPGRLGAATWGTGRGAAPPRFDRG